MALSITKIFEIHSLLAPHGEPGRVDALPQLYPHPNFLKEETEIQEVSKLPKVSELVNAFNLKSVAKTLEGVDWVGGEGQLSPCIVQMPKTPQVTQIKLKQFKFYMQKDKTSQVGKG